MRDLIDVTKALADENRLRALFALSGRELCVCQIIELLGLAPSTVSKHLSILRHARLVESRKNGRWMFYRLAGDNAAPVVREALERISRSMQGDKELEKDIKKLRFILTIDPETLCKRLGKC